MASVYDTPLNASVDVGWTAADLVDHFGAIPVARVCLNPAPGTATVDDAVRISETEERLVELFDGTLMEKPCGAFESYLALELARELGNFLAANDLGVLLGEAGLLELLPQQVRMADIAFISHARLEGSGFPEKAAPTVGPDLAIEILSPGNTPQEMDRKLRDYFASGARLVWYIDPRAKTARVYTSVETCATLDESGTLDGGDVLPGFSMPLAEFFNRPWEKKS